MTDELTPEQESAVRRLLAQARHDDPVPADVAARLDDTLSDLLADRAAGKPAGAAPVSRLSDVRHRRRRAGRLLLAAAAVLVGGVAVGQYVGGTGAGGDANDAGSAATELDQAPRDSSDRAEADTAGGGDQEEAPTAASGAMSLLDSVRTPVVLSSDEFALDVQRELGRTATARRQAANADYDGVLAFAATNADFVCPDGPYGEGATLPAYYDGEEAVLVLRPPRSGIQRVDLLTCGTAVELDSVELPAP